MSVTINPFAALLGQQIIPESARPTKVNNQQAVKLRHRLTLSCPVCNIGFEVTPFQATKRTTCSSATCQRAWREAVMTDAINRTERQREYIAHVDANRNKGAQALTELKE